MMSNKYERFQSRITKSFSSDSCNLGDCELNDDDLDWILSKLSNSKHLTELFFENGNISDKGIKRIIAFCEGQPQIRIINLSRNKQLTDDGAIALLGLVQISELSFYRNTQISDKFAEALLKTTHIQSIDVRDTSISESKRIEISRHLNKFDHDYRSSEGSGSTFETGQSTSIKRK